MPVTPTFPGVYIEEIPSGVRTITGVATSITAFVGRTRYGTVSEPVIINSFADFERGFGGLTSGSPLGYAVRDFFMNGGSQAIIVRLFHPYFAREADRTSATTAAQDVATAAANAAGQGGATPASVAAAARAQADLPDNSTEPRRSAADAVATAAEQEAAQGSATPASVSNAAAAAVGGAVPVTKARLAVGTANALNLEAANEGTWGNSLRALVDYNTRPTLPTEPANSLFNLFIRDDSTGQIEQHRNVTVVPGQPRQIDLVLANESRLARVRGSLPAARPEASNAPQPGQDIWGDNNPATNSKVTGQANTAVDSTPLSANDYVGPGTENAKQGLFALGKADLFNLLCIPPDTFGADTPPAVYQAAVKFCTDRRAMLLVDPPAAWAAVPETAAQTAIAGLGALGISGTDARNAALYFPRVIEADPLLDGKLNRFVPCGIVAGVMARTDAQRGVWKAPAGLDASLNGIAGLEVNLSDAENGMLNPLGINCLRSFPVNGRVVWGARTLRGADQLADEYKYVPVRRLALFLEESLYRGTQWVVFEPNDEGLWAQIRLNVGAFMQNLFRQGAFQGKTPREAFLVKCDKETTTQNDINLGIVNILVGFAPLKPAEFVIIQIQQLAGQVQS